MNDIPIRSRSTVHLPSLTRTGPTAVAALMALTLSAPPAFAQDLPTLTPDDYDRWESLGSYALDPTGRWLVASVGRNDESTELRLHRADGSEAAGDAGDPVVLEHATAPVFSRDGRWMAYRQGVSPEEREEADEPVRPRLGLRDLESGADTVLFEISSFAFRDDGRWMAARGVPASDSVGADLLVFRPGGGNPLNLGNVQQFAWQDEGPLLAATLRTVGGDGNGVVLFDPDSGRLRTLDSGDALYRSLTWGEEDARLLVFRSLEDDGRDGEAEDLLLWEDVASAPGAVRVLSSVGRADLPDSMRVVRHAGIRLSDDASTVFVGVQRWEPTEAEPDSAAGEGAEDEEGGGAPDAPDPDDPDEQPGADAGDPDDDVDPADVQVWHWDDDLIFRAQESRAAFMERRAHLAAWHVDDDRLVVLGRDLDEPVQVVSGGAWGLVPDYDPYLFERRFGAGTADWYRVDPRTGEREPIADALAHGVSPAPEGGRALVFRDDVWHAVDLATLEWMRLDPAEGPAPAFRRSLADYDYPGARPPWGLGGWMEGGGQALVLDEHDLWLADLEAGSLERLTAGAEEGVRYRPLRPDPVQAAEGTLDPDAPLWMSAFHLTEKTAGFAVREDDEVRRLVWEDAAVRGLEKARDADRYAWRVERWNDSPDVFVAGPELGDPVQVTETNPFQEEYAWGRTELLHYTTDGGHDLQAILAYPADFEEGERYPLILYQYERLSDRLHAYDAPSERSYYDYQTWSQQGYFVLMPDIVYEPGRPGPSALDAVEHALDAAVQTGHVDPERMGLIGHSWGGYQASYLPTRTDRFAAAVAGAAITDFISFPGTVHWSGGLPEFGHWETGQARMAVPPWEDVEGHLESSPVHEIDRLETPVLLMHGDDDGVVDFRQGLQYYNYARRAGKPVVMLVYPGAGHGLSQESHQIDYHRRILEWFDHWLKGEEPARWIVEGEDFQAREERIEGGG